MSAMTVSRSRRSSVGVGTGHLRESRQPPVGRGSTAPGRADGLRGYIAAVPAAGRAADGVPARDVAHRMAEAAGAWLDGLDAEQRRIALGAAPGDDPSDAERRRWFYTPTDHGG